MAAVFYIYDDCNQTPGHSGQNTECHLSIGIGALDQFLDFYEVLQNSLKGMSYSGVKCG